METLASVSPPVSQKTPSFGSTRRLDLAVGAVVVLALVGVAFALVARGGVFFNEGAQDVFIPLEGVLHLRAGQWPHRDFVTPVGSAWYAINALPGLFMPLSVRSWSGPT